MKKRFYQQGDVLVKRVKRVKGEKLNHLTLAEGEATGHHHSITQGEAELYDDGGKWYLRVLSEEAILTHQEHCWKKKLEMIGSVEGLSKDDVKYLKEIGIDLSLPFPEIIEKTPSGTVIKKGDYEIGIVREYDYDTEETRRVLD